MANGVEELLTLLYNMVQDAFSVPFGADRCILDRDKVMALIDEINSTLPVELKQAKHIVGARNELMSAAKRDAEAVKRQAEERARQMVSNEEVLLTARQKAADVTQAAESKAREMRRSAHDYVETLLKRTEEGLTAVVAEIHTSRLSFRTAGEKK